MTESLLMLLVLVLAMGWFTRCCESSDEGYVYCSNCAGTGSNATQYMTVEISGMADDYCSNCEAWNGTFVLTFAGGTNPSACRWDYEGSAAVCPSWSATVIHIELTPVPNYPAPWFHSAPDWDEGWYCRLWSTAAANCGDQFFFREDQYPTDCLTTTDLELTDFYDSYKGASCDWFCDASSAVITVSSDDTT